MTFFCVSRNGMILNGFKSTENYTILLVYTVHTNNGYANKNPNIYDFEYLNYFKVTLRK